MSAEAAPRGPRRILIVEDDRDIRENLEDFLGSEGYPVETARNGREAIELLGRSADLPDLILLDLMMPVMDGMAFRREQREDARLDGIPVVLMTADVHIDEKRVEMGAVASLRKPFEIAALLRTIEECLAPPRRESRDL